MTEEERYNMYEKAIRNAPLQFVSKKDELTELQERWTSLIRNHGSKMCSDEKGNTMMKPDLFDIANEIDSFFKGLKANQKR